MRCPEGVYLQTQLEQLNRPSEVSLGLLPTVNEAIQLSTIMPRDYRELIVAAAPADTGGTVTIRRQDNRPLAIDAVVVTPALLEHRRSVLKSPVAQFVLKSTGKFGYWQLIEGQEALSHDSTSPGLAGFFDLVAVFAVRKQRQLAARAEQARLNDLLEGF